MHSLTPASQSTRLGHNCSKSCIAISTMHLWEEVPQLRHSWTDGDLQGSPCTKFLERMGSSREISYPSMANTAHGLKASIKRLFHNTKIKWYKMVQNGKQNVMPDQSCRMSNNFNRNVDKYFCQRSSSHSAPYILNIYF